MSKTGFKQATIAYSVSSPGGEPLDVEGVLTRISGKKQAIALLTGTVNPNPKKYEVAFYFDKEGAVTGNPTVIRDVVSCPFGRITLSLERVVLSPDVPSVKVILESTNAWKLTSKQNTALVDYTSGAAGRYELTISRTGTVGQGFFTFRNEATLETVTLYVINVNSKPWILDTGRWNMLGFWYSNSKWKFNP